MASAEAELATALRETGTIFLKFYRMGLKGEAPDEAYQDASLALGASIMNAARIARERASSLHTQEREGIDDGRAHRSLRQETLAMASAAELSVKKMAEVRRSLPSFEESDTLTPIKPLADLLKEMGHKLLAIATTFEELDELGRQTEPDRLHRVRAEDRLAGLLVEAQDLMRLSRERMAVAVVELELSKRRPT